MKPFNSVVPLAGPFLPLSAVADWQVNLGQGVTEISRTVFDLHMLILYICVAIGVVVFGVMAWSFILHRKSRGAVAHDFHENRLIEITWALIPLLILVAMAVPAAKTLFKMYDHAEAGLDIQVTGYQWKWRYQYLGHDIDSFSNLATPWKQINNEMKKDADYLLEVDNPLVIPVGMKVRFLLTSNDVIHSWWVPALAVKKDAIPGFINEAWTKVDEPGTYRGQCAEFCGLHHGFMPIVVEAKNQVEFQQWLAKVKSKQQELTTPPDRAWTLSDLAMQGEQVYNRVCVACHQANGEGIPGAFPALKGSAVVMGDIGKHIDVVMNGRTGTAMQAFSEQLNPTDVAAVISYERNAWGNDTGDMVTPQEIQLWKQVGGADDIPESYR